MQIWLRYLFGPTEINSVWDAVKLWQARLWLVVLPAAVLFVTVTYFLWGPSR